MENAHINIWTFKKASPRSSISIIKVHLCTTQPKGPPVLQNLVFSRSKLLQIPNFEDAQNAIRKLEGQKLQEQCTRAAKYSGQQNEKHAKKATNDKSDKSAIPKNSKGMRKTIAIGQRIKNMSPDGFPHVAFYTFAVQHF